ncbi:SDR family oxidoreductase [Dyadobacter subterraneus]|uniref:SDR family oxidoreductase n=1 Tax=Dyadobacter subterraneus TaxID=2773304 RepID=A0ABR9WD25_9BACT|nr:SDR family oxidoreductase [Dyadobacter subterraneus]MBE9463370.1 SDR family oxidoreductase [Dyadobacter subterraneus]
MSQSTSASILITGATGNIGKELTKHLASKGIPFRAMVRSMDNLQDFEGLNFSGAEVISGDFNNPESLQNALKGIEKAFLLTNSSEQAEQQQATFVNLAADARVKHIVKLSQWAADINSPVRFLRYHAVIENLIKESGMAYTFLRPNLFMQGLLGFRETIIKQNQFFGAIGNAKISIVDTRDIAAVAGEVLSSPGHEGKIYNLTGPESLTHHEMAEKLSATLGRKIEFIDITPKALKQTLLHVGFPEWQAEGLVEDYAHYKLGEASEVKFGVREAIGNEAKSFDYFVKDYASMFSA